MRKLTLSTFCNFEAFFYMIDQTVVNGICYIYSMLFFLLPRKPPGLSANIIFLVTWYVLVEIMS